VALYADLHRHLGGSVVPRVLWRYFQRHDPTLAEQFPSYLEFEEFYTRPRNTLDEYLELHTVVASVQTPDTLPYFIYRLIRGAYVFENLAYLELRYTPYLRTDDTLEPSQRIDQMRDIVKIVGEASKVGEYPMITSQILCMHSRLSYEVNRAIVDLAADHPNYVCGVDLAGGDALYADRLDEFKALYRYARSRGLKTTGHVFETTNGLYRTASLSHAYWSRHPNPAKISGITARISPTGTMFRNLPHYLYQDWYVGSFIATENRV